MPSDRHFIDGVEHVVTTFPGNADLPKVIPVEPIDGSGQSDPQPAVSGKE